MSSATQDFVAGCFGGAGQLISGHPFDTIKVKLQSQPKVGPGESPLYTGAFDATKKTLAEQGVGGLFKGMGAPLATVAIFNAVLFSARGQMEKLLAHADGSALTVGDQFKAGLGAGVAASMVACPTELIKCRLQAQSGSAPDAAAAEPSKTASTGKHGSVKSAEASAKPAKVYYKGPMDVARKVWATEGGPLGLYKGLAPTLLREVPGNALMFGAYEALKQQARKLQGLKEDEKLGLGSLIVSGGLAGCAFWGPVYPADIIKSKIQVDSFTNPEYKGILDCARKTIHHQGIGGLYKGFGPALIRGFPANGTCFAVYELVSQLLSKATD